MTEDLFAAFKAPAMMPLLMASLHREIEEAFEEYWNEHSGEYEHPELTHYEFLTYLPMEFRMLQMEYGKLLYQAVKTHGDVSLVNLLLLSPDDTIIATFKTK